MNIDRCFLGACALSAKSGLGAIHHGDALFKRAVLTVSQTCIVMVSNEKLSAKAPHRIAQAKVLNQVILEEDAPTDVLAELRRSGVAFLLAKVST
jgi:DeoR/GlpR family transcriptional regulator of sugar metabolism